MTDAKIYARVLIASTDAIWRLGWKNCPELPEGLVICGEATTTPQCRQMLAGMKPDLLILDLDLPGGMPLELAREIKREGKGRPRVLVFGNVVDGTAEHLAREAQTAIKAGAHGWLHRSNTAEEVARAVVRVLAGDYFLTHSMDQALLASLQGKRTHTKRPQVEMLSEAEEAVWDLLGRGLSTREIAGKLHRDIKTIETHYTRMKGKLGAQSLDELRRKALLFWKI